MGMLGEMKQSMVNKFSMKKKEPQFDDEIAKFVNDEYEKRRTARLPFELQWRLNGEFLAGNQMIGIDTYSMTLQEAPKVNWHEEREVFNQLATIYETRVAQLSRTIPKMKVRPASQDDGDIGAAKVSSALLNSTWHDENMEVEWDDLCAWAELTGTAFIKSIWDKDKGPIAFTEMVPKEKVESKDSNGDTKQVEEMLEFDTEEIHVREGDIDSMVVSSYEMFPDNNYASDLSKCFSIIHAKAYPVKDVEEIWGVRVEGEKVDVMSMQQLQSGTGGLGYTAGGFKGKSQTITDHVIVKEYYERSSKKYPNGRLIIVAGKKVLHLGELPFQIGSDGERDFPFSIARSIKKPGQLWGVSVIERLIPVQRRYNAQRNRKAEYLNRVVIGQWLTPEGALSDDSELNDEPGNVIEYRVSAGGGKPEMVQMPNLPASFENEIATLLSEFTAISGVSELSRYSQAPSGVKSGVALSIANEQDNTRISNTATNLALCIKKTGQQWLRLYRQFAQQPRVLKIAGSDSDVEVVHWNNSHLRSDDVIIENSSALAETPAQRKQMVFDMLASGLFNKEEASPVTDQVKRKIFELLEYGNWEQSMQEINRLQEQKAKRENMKLKVGELLIINDFDDDELHIEMHNRLRMSAEYEEILATPEGQDIDGIFLAHIEMHAERIQMKQQQAIMQQMMLQGGLQQPSAPNSSNQKDKETE